MKKQKENRKGKKSGTISNGCEKKEKTNPNPNPTLKYVCCSRCQKTLYTLATLRTLSLPKMAEEQI